MDAWIVTDNDELAERLIKSFAALGIACVPERVLRIESIAPESKLPLSGLVFYAVHELGVDFARDLRLIQSAAENGIRLVVVSKVVNYGTVLEAIRAGASDFLSVDHNLQEELRQLAARLKDVRALSTEPGRVISVVPCHSSRDADLISVNLAAVFAGRMGTCSLLDFQFRGGNLALMLKLEARHTIMDVLHQDGVIDEAILEQAVTPHESGIHLIAGPDEFIDLGTVRLQSCQQIIELGQRSHPVVVINCEDAQHAEQVRALATSDAIVLAIRLDVVSLHRACKHLEFLTGHRVPREQIHVVALGVGQPSELPISAVKKLLEISAIHGIPDDPLVTLCSVNLGNPVVLEAPGSKISRALSAFADAISAEANVGTGKVDGPAKVQLKDVATRMLTTFVLGKRTSI